MNATKTDWQSELKNNITSIEELQNYVSLSDNEKDAISGLIDLHPMNIPRYYANLIDKTNPDDPIKKMAVPSIEELVIAGSMGETTGDPYGDDKHDKGNGILHKYPYTALVVATEYCSMYCRHCFRKRLVGLSNDKTVENFRQASEYIRRHTEITNVVISGGDPLLLPTPVLREMLEALIDIKHINYIRIGSRAPVVFPQRFDDDSLIRLLQEINEKKTLFIPTHFNHAKELTNQAVKAVQKIRSTGTAVNNQAVLLKGVNDSEEALYELMTGLTRAGVNPYYLYQCMPVSRVRHHFQVPLKAGADLVAKVKSRLDGYAKRFKFIMGHDIGKIEICGRKENTLVMNQIHSRPDHPEECSRIILAELKENAGWLEDLTIL